MDSLSFVNNPDVPSDPEVPLYFDGKLCSLLKLIFVILFE